MTVLATGNRWHALLHTRMRGSATPLLVLPDTLWSAASLWAGSRAWLRAFRAAGLVAGDRVVCALPPGPGFVQVLVACLWDQLVFAPVPDAAPVADACREVGARLCVSTHRLVEAPCAHWAPDAASQPPQAVPACAPAPSGWSATTDAEHPALLLRTSGSSGAARWIGLSNDNLFAVLDSHRAALALDHAIVLSVLPWHHAFGLVLGLLAALRDADEVHVGHHLAHDPDGVAAWIARHPVTHVDLVPALVERWSAHPGLRALIARVRGVVGGAAVSATVSQLLTNSRFRVGYGQTEAAPGIMLGRPGEFRVATIGRPVGCEVRVDGQGELLFRGPNACHGVLTESGYEALAPSAWRRTGDRVQAHPDGTWQFLGRVLPTFKLRNGRMLDVTGLEAQLQEVLPRLDPVVVPDHDGGFRVALCTDAAPELDGLVRRDLGALRGYCSGVVVIPPDAWPRTPKGNTDRRRLAEVVVQRLDLTR